MLFARKLSQYAVGESFQRSASTTAKMCYITCQAAEPEGEFNSQLSAFGSWSSRRRLLFAIGLSFFKHFSGNRKYTLTNTNAHTENPVCTHGQFLIHACASVLLKADIYQPGLQEILLIQTRRSGWRSVDAALLESFLNTM